MQFDIGNASLGSNCWIVKKNEEYIAPPPIPQAFANAEHKLRIRISKASIGYIGKKPLNVHFCKDGS